MGETSRNVWQCAPFNVSEAKTSCFEGDKKINGPGSYEPKYYKDLNKGSEGVGYVFASKVDRFKTANKTPPAHQSPILKLTYAEPEPLNRSPQPSPTLVTHASLSPSWRALQRK
jgi:hypothetical protein